MNTTRLRNFEVCYQNSEEFHQIKNELFVQHSYYFETDKKKPVIVDVGAHIGLSLLYFKMLYPSAQIIAVEPNPHNYDLLRHNIELNQLQNVDAILAAVGSYEGGREFFVDQSENHWYSTGSFSHGAWNKQQQSTSFFVRQIKLSTLLSKSIDLLKLDIEGAEKEVFGEIADKLSLVAQLLFEFHPMTGNTIDKILSLLEKERFQVTFTQEGKVVDPFKSKGLLIGHAVKAS